MLFWLVGFGSLHSPRVSHSKYFTQNPSTIEMTIHDFDEQGFSGLEQGFRGYLVTSGFRLFPLQDSQGYRGDPMGF
jgi:hypothetical protein